MIAYEFYLRDPVKGDELVGILPERRKDPATITQESVLLWGKTVLGNSSSNQDIHVIKIQINQDGENIFPPAPFSITQQKINK